MTRLPRAAVLCAGVFLLMLPAGIPLSGAAASAIPPAAQQSQSRTKRKAKPKASKKILKGRHERHHRKPA
jgi:hypothetical protein